MPSDLPTRENRPRPHMTRLSLGLPEVPGFIGEISMGYSRVSTIYAYGLNSSFVPISLEVEGESKRIRDYHLALAMDACWNLLIPFDDDGLWVPPTPA